MRTHYLIRGFFLILPFAVGCAQHKETSAVSTPPAHVEAPRAATAPTAVVEKSDLELIQGKWKGKERGSDPEPPCRLIVDGNKLEFRGANPDEWYKTTFTIREGTRPKQLVADILECGAPDYVGKKTYVIFHFEEGKLKMAGSRPGSGQAPADFDSADARCFEFSREP